MSLPEQPRKRGRPRKNPVVVEKAGNSNVSTSRLRMSEMGTLALSQIRVDAESMAPRELKWPNCVRTFTSMKQDESVSQGLNLKYMFIEKAFYTWSVIPKQGSKKSKEAADFITWCLNNMDSGTVRQMARSAATFNEYGFSVLEKVFTLVTSGKYAGKYKIKKLASRPQASLDAAEPFTFVDGGKEILSINQNPSYFKNSSGVLQTFYPALNDQGKISIPFNKCMIFAYNATESNPFGESPLYGCYKAWREKVLIQNYEVIGAARDLGGILELKVPSDILNKAALDPSSAEAEFVQGLMRDAANAHAGEQAFFMLPSDTEGGHELYKMTLKGVDGGSKMFNTTELINVRHKAILDCLGAGFINLGNDSNGSYALSEGKQSLHAHYVERDVDTICEQINVDLIPQLLALNSIYLEDDEMPKFQAGMIEDVDLQVFSAAVQRMGAAGYLPRTKEVINKVLEVMGIDWKLTNQTQEEILELVGKPTTRAGDGMAKGSLNGTSDDLASSDNSVSNAARETV